MIDSKDLRVLDCSELRIGNLVLDSTKNTTKIESIIPEHNRVRYGIKLTEHWLERFGFEKVPHYTVTNSLFLNIGRNRQISVGCVGTPNEMVFLAEADDDENHNSITSVIVIRNYDYDGKTYVHTIQNIVKDLTGKELELTKQ